MQHPRKDAFFMSHLNDSNSDYGAIISFYFFFLSTSRESLMDNDKTTIRQNKKYNAYNAI